MIQLQLKDFHLPGIFREVVASCTGRKSWLSYHWHDSKTKLNVLDWRVISRSFAHVTTVKTDYLEVSKTNQPPTGINKLRQCHWWLHCRARRSHLLSSILIPNRDAIEPQILGHFGKYGIMFGTNWNHFILKEPNSDLYNTFFCDPNGAGQRIFLSPEDAPQRQLWPGIQRLCLTKDGAERKWGSRMGHTCSSLSCVNHPIGKPKELTQTYGVWNVEAAWIRIRKDLGLGFYQWLSKE